MAHWHNENYSLIAMIDMFSVIAADEKSPVMIDLLSIIAADEKLTIVFDRMY